MMAILDEFSFMPNEEYQKLKLKYIDKNHKNMNVMYS